MRTLARFTVERHGVTRDAEGLSTMQASLLSTTHLVNIANAPTGAGKSHVFRLAVERRGERVLFIVPTKRLASNLMEGLRESLAAAGRPAAVIERKVQRWTSEQTATLKAAGVKSVMDLRQRELLMLHPEEGGEIVFATPEVVSLLLEPRYGTGLRDTGPGRLMGAFDHIVFDEFHLIDERMFALAGFLAGLAKERLFGTAKVHLLSATPIDIQSALASVGVAGDQVVRVVDETILQGADLDAAGGRALHGDVEFRFVEADSPLDVAEPFLEEARAMVAAADRALVIYDGLARHQRDQAHWRALLEDAGFASERCLFDSSLDGARVVDGVANRERSLETMDVVVATSTVEVGVTIPRLRLVLMEPGFNPASFLQRAGRVARGDLDGSVIVVVSRDRLRRTPWLAALVAWAKERQAAGGRVGVSEMNAALAAIAMANTSCEEGAVVADPQDGEAQDGGAPALFGVLGKRAAWCCGLMWYRMIDLVRKSEQREHLQRIRECVPPPQVNRIRAMLSDLCRAEASAWVRQFLTASARLRDIGPAVMVRENGGASPPIAVPVEFLTRATTILEEHATFVENGEPTVIIDGVVGDHIRDASARVEATRPALLPFQAHAVIGTRNPIWDYGRQFDRKVTACVGQRLEREHRKALSLVQMTGIVPYVDE